MSAFYRKVPGPQGTHDTCAETSLYTASEPAPWEASVMQRHYGMVMMSHAAQIGCHL